jgi:hypothetical protein
MQICPFVFHFVVIGETGFSIVFLFWKWKTICYSEKFVRELLFCVLGNKGPQLLTSCTPTESDLHFDISLAIVMSETAIANFLHSTC